LGESYEALIIGGGPAGLTAGIYLMRGGISALLIDKTVAGGTPMKYEFVENYPGFPEGIPSKDLMKRMIDQARRFGLVMQDFFDVTEARFGDGRFTLRSGDSALEALSVIIATGTESKKLDIPGESELMGMGVSTCATCDGMFFRGLEVAVVGGGDAAIQEGLTLANLASKVYVIHRRDALRAQKIIQDRAFRQPNMEFLWNKKPLRILGANQVEGLILEDTKTGVETELKVDGVFIYAGAKPGTDYLGDLVDRDETGFIVARDDLSTKTPGLFAAGDCRKKSLRQISTAVGDGALAAISCEKYIVTLR
jgi:thioredoxin reductase (NADPH)